MVAATGDPLGLQGQTLEGKYLLEQYVAKGGFGVVYRAQHLRLRRPVAVKILRLDQKVTPDEWAIICRDFEEEAQHVAQLDHPAIVRVMDYGVTKVAEEEVPWMAVEWVDGQTLATELRGRRGQGGRSPRECLTLLKPVFEALVYAHEQRIAHRDIKPANLMFTGAASTPKTASRVGVPLVKLLDFGIAKVMEPDERAASGETATTSVRISFSMKYGAPEQFSGGRTGPWTDLYAMALVLTELLTDRPPYEGRDAMDFHMAAMNPQRPTPGRYGVDVGPWEPVLAKALALRPADRFATMEEFLRALEAAVPEGVRPLVSPAASVPVVPTDSVPSTTGTLPPVISQTATHDATARRTRMAAVAGAVVLLLVGVGVVASTGGAPRSTPTPHAAVATPPHPVTAAVVAPVAPQPPPPAAAPDAAGAGTFAAPAAEEGDAGRRRSRHRRPSREDGPRPTKQGGEIGIL